MEIIVISHSQENRAAFDSRFQGTFDYTFRDAIPAQDAPVWAPYFTRSDIYDFPWRMDPNPTIARAITHFQLWKEKVDQEIVVLDDSVEWWETAGDQSKNSFLSWIQNRGPMEYLAYFFDGKAGETYVTNKNGFRVHPGKAYSLRPMGTQSLIAKIENYGFNSSLGWEMCETLYFYSVAPDEPIFISNSENRYAVKNEQRPLNGLNSPNPFNNPSFGSQEFKFGEPLPLFFPREFNDQIKNGNRKGF